MSIRYFAVLLLASCVAAGPGLAAPAADVTVPIHQFIDGFNTGDTAAAYAAYAPGEISIIDEFAPHVWLGPKAPQNWAAAYDRHAKETGVSDGNVAYGKPTRAQVNGNTAYVILPAVYTYKQSGKPTAEEAQMTFVLHDSRAGWKITAWTWTGVVPHPAK